MHRIAGAAAALVGPPSIVIHNASTLGPVPMPLLLDTECEDLERVLAVNLVGPFRLTKVLAGRWCSASAVVVLFVSSDAAVSAYARWGSYGVSKAAQDHLARSFAAELDPVRFFAVDPGEMDTKMHADAIPEAESGVARAPGRRRREAHRDRRRAPARSRTGRVSRRPTSSRSTCMAAAERRHEGGERSEVREGRADPRRRRDVRRDACRPELRGRVAVRAGRPARRQRRRDAPGVLRRTYRRAARQSSFASRRRPAIAAGRSRSSGSGDWRTRTEDRPPPPRVAAGDRLLLGEGLTARAIGLRPESPRLVGDRARARTSRGRAALRALGGALPVRGALCNMHTSPSRSRSGTSRTSTPRARGPWRCRRRAARSARRRCSSSGAAASRCCVRDACRGSLLDWGRGARRAAPAPGALRGDRGDLGGDCPDAQGGGTRRRDWDERHASARGRSAAGPPGRRDRSPGSGGAYAVRSSMRSSPACTTWTRATTRSSARS